MNALLSGYRDCTDAKNTVKHKRILRNITSNVMCRTVAFLSESYRRGDVWIWIVYMILVAIACNWYVTS